MKSPAAPAHHGSTMAAVGAQGMTWDSLKVDLLGCYNLIY